MNQAENGLSIASPDEMLRGEPFRTPHSLRAGALSEPEAAFPIPELLAPAGDWECAKAAVENGADAIYFGLSRFNARMRAQNFTEADLSKLMEFLRHRGVKGYVTFNTLIFANELAEAEQQLRAMISAGVDAAIVQDVGICRLIRRLSPDFPIHASTQMTITSAEGVEFARELGCSLVVLARECSIKEIQKIVGASERAASESGENAPTLHAPRSILPIEVFVHGALCVAYSGQCLTSEALGGRSANRGECAQACRMPYELIADGKPVPLGDRRYLLSPQDLAGLELLPELIRAGVASLKIEGRLKSPEYVANITRVYRKAIDRVCDEWLDGQKADRVDALAKSLRSEFSYDLEMAFSRGLYTGWLDGTNNQELVHGRFGKKRGVYLGDVVRVDANSVRLRLCAPLKPGDGVVFDAGHPEEKEEGGRVYSADRRGEECTVSFGRGDLDFTRIHAGDKVWKTSDPELQRQLRKTYSGVEANFQRPLNIEVRGGAGEPLTVTVRDDLDNVVQVCSRMPLAQAEKQPLAAETLRQHLGRLGGTPFKLGRLENHLAGSVILPFSEMNRLRREAIRSLEALRMRPKRWALECGEERSDSPLWLRHARTLRPPSPRLCRVQSGDFADSVAAVQNLADLRGALDERASVLKCGGPTPHSVLDPSSRAACRPRRNESDVKPSHSINLVVLVRSLTQLETALDCGVTTVYCELEDPKRYREAVARFRERQDESFRNAANAQSQIANRKSEIFVAPPRIFKPGEDWILKLVRSSNADGYLIRNYDHLKFFSDTRGIGDYSLNVANPLSAEYFMTRFALERLTASYDLNFRELEALLRSAPPEWFEVTVHQHMPMFHMEHCVFCAFLSQGTNYTNCGRPCDRHEVKLRDRVGAEHPLKADAGCRNTVFNALAQTGAESVTRMLRLGVRHFRLEFLTETPEQVAQTIQKYRQVLRGETRGTEVWRELKLVNQLGVTRGQL